MQEERSPGSLVGDIAADTHLLDHVSPQDRRLITFSQLHQGVTGSPQLFSVSKGTGKIYTTQKLDAETLCRHNTECFQTMKVAVRRGESFIKILKIKIIIQDVNDHQPEFPEQRVEIEFSERDGKGTKISIPNAIDKDVGALNSQIKYQIQNIDEPFILSVSQRVDGTSELSICLEEKLDREVKDSYMIQVIAKDGGSPPKQSVLDVHISVTDVNDNSPLFSQSVYSVSVKNNHQRSRPVAILSTRDLDSGRNGKITYHFSSKTSDIVKSHFELNEVTGEIFLNKKFTSRQDLTYKLFVEATDAGNPPLTSIAMVLVNVINQQNNPPIIDVNFVRASQKNTATISEDIEVGSFIAYVMVIDHDVGQNGEVTCELHHNKFQLQNLGPKEYKVTINSPVDREREDHYDVTISCQDKGFPPLHSESKFSIQVMDINDVRPQFSKDTFKFWIYENQKSKFPVGYINATDPDLGPGGQLTYTLLTNNINFIPFQISDDGLITTVMSLDHEFKHIYKFRVLVKDSGNPSLNNTANVVVEVRDENDNAPYFTYPSVNPFTLDFTYYPRHTNNITVLRASDSDSRENAFLKYEITGGNDNQLFNINPYTGLLSFTRVVSPQDAGSYELDFTVKDSGIPVHSENTTIYVLLTVSNKSSEMLNAVHIESDEKIHLYLLIVLVSVAVTVSVPVTAAISICIIRCNAEKHGRRLDRGNVSGGRCVVEQRHLARPSDLQTSCSNMPVAVTGDPDKSRVAHQEFLAKSSGQKSSTLGMKILTATEVIHEVCLQEVPVPARGKEGEKNSITSPDYYSLRSMMASRAKNEGHWTRHSGHGEKGSERYAPEYCPSVSSRSTDSQDSDMKHIQQSYGYPSDESRSSQKSNRYDRGSFTPPPPRSTHHISKP